MKIRNYCIIALGRIDGVKDEIKVVASSYVNFAEHKNIVIATFSSPDSAKVLKEFFVLKNRGFFLFELGEDNYGVNVGDNDIYKTLFQPYEEENSKLSDEILNRTFLDKLSGVGVDAKITDIYPIDEDLDDETKIENEIQELSKTERQELVDSIIDKGINNISDLDKIRLSKLSNFK